MDWWSDKVRSQVQFDIDSLKRCALHRWQSNPEFDVERYLNGQIDLILAWANSQPRRCDYDPWKTQNSNKDQSGGGFESTGGKAYEVVNESRKFVRKYNATAYSTTIRAKIPQANRSQDDWFSFVSNIVESVCAEKFSEVEHKDFVRVVMTCPGMRDPISTKLMRKQEFSHEYLLAVLERVLQSNESLELDQPITFYMTSVKEPRGGKSPWLVRHTLTLDEARKKLKCILQVRARDNLCLPAALCLCAAALRYGTRSHQFKNMCRSNRVATLERHARNLFFQVFGMNHAGEMCGLDHLQRFQENYYYNFQIVVFTWNPRQIIWRGNADQNLPDHCKAFLIFDTQNNHFDVLNSPAAFLRRSVFCLQCLKGYDVQNRHACFATCKGCFKPNCPDKNLDNGLPCTLCNRVFPGPNCFQRHLYAVGQNPSLCERYRKCAECGRSMRNGNMHMCKHVYCAGCKTYVERGHLCYIKGLQNRNDAENDQPDDCLADAILLGEPVRANNSEALAFEERPYVYYDIEAYPKIDTGEHVCNLIVAHHNHGAEKVFKPPDDPVDSFCRWALNPEVNANTTFVAHNAKRYDSYFVMRWVLLNCHERIEPIVNGGQLLCLVIKDLKIRFIDSISFLAAPLSKLPAMFGLNEELENGAVLQKGFFPHLFNRPHNYNYDGPMPDIQYYDPENMNAKRREEFENWYRSRQEQNYRFRFWDELISYCRMDVTVLRRCCESFRELFFQETTVDPFESVTIASACNVVFRKCFLREETIAIIPPNGYVGRDKQSFQATQWLLWRQYQENGVPMRHSMNGREVTVPIGNGRQFYRLDGVWLNDDGTETKSALEFLGCFFHGCPTCYRPDSWNPMFNKNMGALYAEWMVRAKRLQDLGWAIESKWECEWRREKQRSQDLKEFLAERETAAQMDGHVSFVEPLVPRDAFFGGRTNAACLYYKVSEEQEKIRYIDINSLYPYVNKWREWPCGHPEIFVGPAADKDKISDYFGIAKCLILPPRNLFHPILPARVEGKLMFVLCRSCAQNKAQLPCAHDDRDRALYGTWVTEEIKLAIANGYTLLRLDEVWHFSVKDNKLFADYINKFLKLKQETRGWPSHVDQADESSKLLYINNYEAVEGIRLDIDNIRKNPGLYQIAKACLNSFWGKFGQRLNLGKLALIRDEEEFWRFLLNDSITISDLTFHGEEVAQIEYANTDAFVMPGLNTNIVIAAFTTAYARMHLWATLGPLEERALYYDTDSIIYIDRAEEWCPPTGEYLGQFKDELESPDGEDWIVEFMSGGPKNYGYITKNGKSCLKVRGFTLNPLACQTLNLGVVKRMVQSIGEPENVDTSIEVRMGTTIKRHKKTWALSTVNNIKKYRIVYEKRVICQDGRRTVPYGYVP